LTSQNKITLVVVSDLHVGSTVGLCSRGVALDDGGTYRPSKAQRWLRQCWDKAWDRVEAVRDDGPLWVVFNGDLIDGDHHNTHQLFTRSEEKQAEVCIDIIDPILQRSSESFIIRGTQSHVGQSGLWEERIAYDLDTNKDTLSGTSSWWHLPLMCAGVRFDFAHFGKVGYRAWTRPNAANVLAAETMLDYASTGDKPPHVVVRSHRHTFVDSGQNYPVRVVQTPAWQLASGYVKSYLPGVLADIGLIIFTCENGKYIMEPVRFRPKRRSAWMKKTISK